jgi:hypothetical protein
MSVKRQEVGSDGITRRNQHHGQDRIVALVNPFPRMSATKLPRSSRISTRKTETFLPRERQRERAIRRSPLAAAR